jgi:hypothetical protein
MWTELTRLYFESRLGLVKTYLHQSNYKKAVKVSIDTQIELQNPQFGSWFPAIPTLGFKFFKLYLCCALARTANREIEMAMAELEEAANYLASSLPSGGC